MMPISKGNLYFDSAFEMKRAITYDELLEYGADDNTFYINRYSSCSYQFISPDGKLLECVIQGQYEPLDLITKKDLVVGRLPENKTEILVSRSIADDCIRYGGQKHGIWNYEQLFYEVVDFNIVKGKIVGIVDSDVKIIYMDRFLATIGTTYQGDYQLVSSDFAPSELLSGRLPQDKEALIPHALDESLTEIEKELLGYEISGVYYDENEHNIIYRTTNDIERYLYDNSCKVFVRTQNPSKLIEELTSDTLIVRDVYQEAYDVLKEELHLVHLAIKTLSFILLGLAILGFYFLMRSNLIARLYEISIFRALGLRKEYIFRSFVVEILIITTITSLISYIIMMFGLYKLQSPLIKSFMFPLLIRFSY